MTTKEFKKLLDRQLDEINKANIFFLTISESHARQVKRIFVEGQNEMDTDIGQYNSTAPIYISPIQSPIKISPKGKSGSSVFKNGKAHKSAYFDSYKAFRSAIGRQVSKVNLRLSEALKIDFQTSLQRSGEDYISGIKNDTNVGKAEGAIDRYGDIFHYTISEKKYYYSELKKDLLNFLNGNKRS